MYSKSVLYGVFYKHLIGLSYKKGYVNEKVAISVVEKSYHFDFLRDIKLAKDLNVLLMCWHLLSCKNLFKNWKSLLLKECFIICFSLLIQKVAMRALGFDVKKADVLKILKDYDREATGKITFEDFNEVGVYFNSLCN